MYMTKSVLLNVQNCFVCEAMTLHAPENIRCCGISSAQDRTVQ